MTAILYWLAQSAIIAALMVPVIMLACHLFRRRPAVQHLLWLVVLVKLMIPPVVAWPWSLDRLGVSMTDLRITDASPIRDSQTNTLLNPPAMELVPRETDRAQPDLEPRRDESPRTSRLIQTVTWHLPEVLAVVWIAGMIVTLCRQFRLIRHFALLVGNGSAAPEHLQQHVAQTARLMNSQCPRVVVVDAIHAPFVWCSGPLQLVWPAALLKAENIEDTRSIIAHELAHILRRDHWIAWLELMTAVVFWWFPLLPFVRRRMREAAELSCDALALAACSDERRTYAEFLLSLSSYIGTQAPAAVLGVSSNSRSFFERRLTMILTDGVSGRVTWLGLVAVLFLALTALPTWSTAKEPAAESQTKEAPTGGKALGAKDAVDNTQTPPTNQKQRSGANSEPAGELLKTTGKVVDSQGRPIGGAKLWWVVAYTGTPGPVTVTGTTDEKGRFLLSTPKIQLPRTTMANDTLWILKEGKQLTTARANSGILYPIQPGESIVRMEDEAEMRFFVEAPGLPQSGVEVEPDHLHAQLGYDIVPDGIRDILREKTTVSSEIKMRCMPPNGLSTVRVTSKAFGIQDFRVDDKSLKTVTTLTLRPTVRIEGQLKAQNPEWVRGVELYFSTESGRMANRWGSEGVANVVTDQAGRFVVPAIAEGGVRVSVWSKKDIPARARVPEITPLRAGQTQVFDIPLEPTVPVRGSVRTHDTDKPVPGAEISVGYGSWHQSEMVVSDAKGRFETRVLPGPVYTQVIARPTEFDHYEQVGSPWNEKTSVPAQNEPFELPAIKLFPTVSIQGKLIDKANRPIVDKEIVGYHENRIYGRGKTNKQGEFSMRIPGNITLEGYYALEKDDRKSPEVIQKDPLILRLD